MLKTTSKAHRLVCFAFLTVFYTTNAFSSEWKSKHFGINLNFDQKTWSMVQKTDNKEVAYAVLFDKKDGSSLFIRAETVENVKEIDDTALEKSLAESLYASDPKLKIKNRGTIEISNRKFHSVDYLYQNKKFGQQIVRHSFIKRPNHVVIILTSWPAKNKLKSVNAFPNKHATIIQKIKF